MIGTETPQTDLHFRICLSYKQILGGGGRVRGEGGGEGVGRGEEGGGGGTYQGSSFALGAQV